jgi:hypothetical protein
VSHNTNDERESRAVSRYGEMLAVLQPMKEVTVTIPEIGLISGTRVAIGVGIGLLIGDRLNKDQRKGAGWALIAIGALSSIPLALEVLGKGSTHEASRRLVA